MNFPKSNVVRMAEGDRGHRTKEQKEKQDFPIPDKVPSRPQILADPLSKKYWNKYVELYRVTDADVSPFTYLCELVAEIDELKSVLKEEGRFFLKVTVDGAGVEHQEKKSHPAFTQLIKLRQEKRILEKEFRIRALCGSPKNKSPLEEMID